MTDKDYIASVPRLRIVAERAVRGFFRHDDDVADVVQEVLMWIWIRRQEVDTDTVDSLAATMARNHAVSIWRKNNNRTAVPLDESDAVATANAQSQMEDAENQRLLQKALECLTPTELRIYRMRHEAGMSTSQTAAALDIDERTVSATLSKARRKIIEQIHNMR